jgi:6-phosphofructokinase 1
VILRHRHANGSTFSIVVVAEGAVPAGGAAISSEQSVDAFGHVRLGGVGVWLEHEIEQRTGYETRVTILGHVQRGGTPTAYDRVLATRFGIAAIDAVHAGAFGTMVALQGMNIVRVPLIEGVGKTKTLDMTLYEAATVFSD